MKRRFRNLILLLITFLFLASSSFPQNYNPIKEIECNSVPIGLLFSPDNKMILSANKDFVFRLWDLTTGALIKSFSGHNMSLTDAGFSPDEKYLLTASYDKSIKIWDIEKGTELFSLLGHSDIVTRAIFSPDGKTIASCSFDKTIKIWDAQIGKLLATFPSTEKNIYSINFSPDGSQIISSGGDFKNKSGEILLWDVKNKTVIKTINDGLYMSIGASFSKDGKYIFSASLFDSTLHVTNKETGKIEKAFTLVQSDYYGIKSSPDPSIIICSSLNSITIISLTDSFEPMVIKYDAGLSGFDISSNGKYYATGPDYRKSETKFQIWQTSGIPIVGSLLLKYYTVAETTTSSAAKKEPFNSHTKKETNAHILTHGFWRYSIILPDSIQLNYMNYYPFTAFNFVSTYNPSIISSLKVEDLKQRYLEWAEKIEFQFIKGFEDYDVEINQANEFVIKEKQQFYINKLIDCWNNYNKEYRDIYLKGVNGTYTYPESDIRNGNRGFELDKTAYDFNNEILEIKLVDNNYDWCSDRFNGIKDYRNIKVNVPISIAKKLFGDNEPCYYQTYVKVKIVPDEHKVLTSSLVSNGVWYDIVQIKKNFYKRERWSDEYQNYIGGPVHTMVFESSEDLPLSKTYYKVYINSLKKQIGFDEFKSNNVEDIEKYCGTYTVYDKTSPVKKGDINIAINQSNNKLAVTTIEYKGRGGSKKNLVVDPNINGNSLSMFGNKYEFVKYNDIYGLLYFEGKNYIFCEKTK